METNMTKKNRFTKREIAEALIPDSSTKPLTDEEIDKLMGDGMGDDGVVIHLNEEWQQIKSTVLNMYDTQKEILNLLKKMNRRDAIRSGEE